MKYLLYLVTLKFIKNLKQIVVKYAPFMNNLVFIRYTKPNSFGFNVIYNRQKNKDNISVNINMTKIHNNYLFFSLISSSDGCIINIVIRLNMLFNLLFDKTISDSAGSVVGPTSVPLRSDQNSQQQHR